MQVTASSGVYVYTEEQLPAEILILETRETDDKTRDGIHIFIRDDAVSRLGGVRLACRYSTLGHEMGEPTKHSAKIALATRQVARKPMAH